MSTGLDLDVDLAHAEVQAAVERTRAQMTEAQPPTAENTVAIVARTIWGEARGYGREGMSLVANVIMNRVARPGWWGIDPASVCLDPFQFSCWLPGDPNLEKLQAVTGRDPDFADALVVAAVATAGMLPDATNGADGYYDTSIDPPSWTKGLEPVLVYEAFRFYRVQPG